MSSCRRSIAALGFLLACPVAFAADANHNGIPDDWEALHTGTFAVWPGDLEQSLLPFNSATKPFLLKNDTSTAVNYTATVTGNTGPVYSAYDSLTGGVAYTWEEISVTGTRLATVSNADDDFEAVPISGFSFPLSGNLYSQVYVSSNGLLSFEDGNTSGGNIPVPGSSPYSIAAFWDDLDTRTNGDVYYKQESNRLIIQYQNVGRYSGMGSYTFQVVLYSSGAVQVRYKTMTGVLNSATVGLEGGNVRSGAAVISNASYVTSGLAVQFDPVSEFFTLATLTGSVPAHTVGSLNALVESMGLAPGLYTANVSVAHNGAGTSPIPLHGKLTVLDQPGTVAITAPLASATVLQSESLFINASATDADGIDRVEFYSGATKIGEVASYPGYSEFGFSWSPDGSGSKSITARMLDIFGAMTVSAPVSVNVRADTDYDGLPDDWEIANYLDPNDPNDRDGDADTDGYTNYEEFETGNDPQFPEDSDFDGMPDGWEFHHGTDLNADDAMLDKDEDGLTNIEEYWYGTDPLTFDTDSDQMPDLWEIDNYLDPLTASATEDADGDGLSNLDEYLHRTDPNNPDSDGDGKSDGVEVGQGSDPKNAADGGNPPADALESVEFLVGGDYASWRMEIKALGPRDTRTLYVVSPAPNQWETKTHKLWKNNKYEITMYHTGSKEHNPEWYCWEAQVDSQPGLETFAQLPDYQIGTRNNDGKYFLLKNHWVVDNTSGLLTSHLHSKGVNKVTGKKATLTPVDIVATFGFGGEPGKEVTTTYLDGASQYHSGKLYMVPGKTPANADKLYSVLLGDSKDDLKQGLGTEGCFVVYDGHSNFGLGPSFDPAAISHLSDFMHIANTYAAINWPYLVQTEYPNLTSIAAVDIPAHPNNYIVPNYAPASNQRYPNINGIGNGQVFSKTGTGMGQKHFDRAGSNIFLIVKAGSADLPPLKYDSYFYNSCNSGRDYIEVFTHGTMFYTGESCASSSTTKLWVKSIIEGKRNTDLLTIINSAEPVNFMINR